MSRLIILLTFLFSSSVVNAAPIEILCRIKGTGQRTFVLDSGFWSSSVMFKAGSGKLTEWCKENADQSVKFGKKRLCVTSLEYVGGYADLGNYNR